MTDYGSQVHINTLINLWLSQEGDEYVFGGEVSLTDPDPDRYDCSEFVEWGCAMGGVMPKMPDGSWNQWAHCRNHDTLIGVEEAIGTRGALLFRIGKNNHVAISLGDGKTIEARGKKYGVGQFEARGRPWTHGALIPGVKYV